MNSLLIDAMFNGDKTLCTLVIKGLNPLSVSDLKIGIEQAILDVKKAKIIETGNVPDEK